MRKSRYEDVVSALVQLLSEGQELERRVGEAVEENDHARGTISVCKQHRAPPRRDDAVLSRLTKRYTRDRRGVAGGRVWVRREIAPSRRRECDEAKE
jgi:hypothetical protein